jgi:hypothetical protein
MYIYMKQGYNWAHPRNKEENTPTKKDEHRSTTIYDTI